MVYTISVYLYRVDLMSICLNHIDLKIDGPTSPSDGIILMINALFQRYTVPTELICNDKYLSLVIQVYIYVYIYLNSFFFRRLLFVRIEIQENGTKRQKLDGVGNKVYIRCQTTNMLVEFASGFEQTDSKQLCTNRYPKYISQYSTPYKSLQEPTFCLYRTCHTKTFTVCLFKRTIALFCVLYDCKAVLQLGSDKLGVDVA